MPSNAPVVLLREHDGDRVLPIWIGAAEAAAIAMGLEGTRPSRPLTHDLLLDLVVAAGRTISRIEIDSMVDHVFHATVTLDDGTEVSARPSDAIALALRAQATVFVAAEVMQEAGLLPEESDEAAPEIDMEEFKAFLESVNPEDFQKPDA